MLKNFNKNYQSNRNISIFTSISYHSVFTRPPFLFFQHNQQCDTLLPIVPCTYKLKAGIAYCTIQTFHRDSTSLIWIQIGTFSYWKNFIHTFHCYCINTLLHSLIREVSLYIFTILFRWVQRIYGTVYEMSSTKQQQ